MTRHLFRRPGPSLLVRFLAGLALAALSALALGLLAGILAGLAHLLAP